MKACKSCAFLTSGKDKNSTNVIHTCNFVIDQIHVNKLLEATMPVHMINKVAVYHQKHMELTDFPDKCPGWKQKPIDQNL